MRVRLLLGLVAATAAAFVAAGSAGAAQDSACPNGILAPGAYQNVTVSSFCSLTGSGTVFIRGNLTVNPGGVFNGAPCTNLFVGGSVAVFATGVIDLTGFCSDKVLFHGLSADRANSVDLRGISIDGGLLISGGGGGPSGACERSDVPLTGVPFNAIEDNEIGGSVNIGNYRGCWQGLFRNSIGGSVNYSFNTVEDPDGNEIADNSIGGNLYCQGNVPAPQFGDSGGGVNSVGGTTFRQCLNVVL
jgi:hypothetical protein